MSNHVKGQWLAVATLAVVTLAWMCSTTCDSGHASKIFVAGMWPGVPYALLAGSLLGTLADRLVRYRALVLVTLALASTLAIDALVGAMMLDNGVDSPSLATLQVLSCLPTLAAAIALERWTRRASPLPEARDVTGA